MIEGTGENKTNKQTWTKRLGLTQEQKGSMQHYISDSIYGLTLALITCENSTKQLECRHLDSIFFTVAGPSLMPLCSGVRSRLPLSVSRHQLSQLLFPTNSLFAVLLPLPDTPRFQVRKPFVWFHAKIDKGIVCLAGHPYSVTHLVISNFFKCVLRLCFKIKSHFNKSFFKKSAWIWTFHFNSGYLNDL